jgi:gliding motility-associated-like protein
MMNSAFFRNSFLVWFLSCISVFGFSQPLTVETSLGNTTACPYSSMIVPVRVANMIGVDTLLLSLNYDPLSLTYDTIQKVNLQLAGGTLKIDTASGLISISWKRINPADILDDTLIELVFNTHEVNSVLSWDTTTPDKSYYKSQGIILPDLFTGSNVNLYPILRVTLDENLPTCINLCDAAYTAFVSGGTKPYRYIWTNSSPDPNSTLNDSIQRLLCAGRNSIKIIDAKGCSLDSSFVIEGLPATNVELKVMPGDTVYMQNPTIFCSFENKSSETTISEWLWTFGDGDSSTLLEPVHTYLGIESYGDDNYVLTLWVKNGFGCDTTITKILPIQESKLFIPTVFSPNANSERNRTFKIVKDDSHEDLTSEYLSLDLQIFNRYGKRIYKSNNYKGDWDGGNLPDGVYYYVLNAQGLFRTDKFKGSVTILGGGK